MIHFTLMFGVNKESFSILKFNLEQAWQLRPVSSALEAEAEDGCYLETSLCYAVGPGQPGLPSETRSEQNKGNEFEGPPSAGGMSGSLGSWLADSAVS